MPDNSFGINGRVDLDIWTDDLPMSLLALPDGKAGIAGLSDWKFSLAVLLPNGELDTGFGNEGIILEYFGGSKALSRGAAVQTNGKLVAGGMAVSGDIVLARYLDDGNLDPSFGTSGKRVTDLKEYYLSPSVISILPDENILVLGAVSPGDLFLYRYLPDGGNPDMTFGEGGLAIIETSSPSIHFNAVALQPDGKYLLGGRISYNFAIGRIFPDGSIDEDFGNEGWVILPQQQNSYVYDLRVQPDGEITAAAKASGGFNVFRFLPSFNFLGKAITGLSYVKAIEILPDGKILAAGDDGNDPAMVRLMPSGAIRFGFFVSNNGVFPSTNLGQ